MLGNLKFKNTKPSSLENEIERLFNKLKEMDPTDPQYAPVAEQLSKLYKLKEVDSKKQISPDAAVATVTNLAGILLILNHERLHVVTSKALGMVRKSIM